MQSDMLSTEWIQQNLNILTLMHPDIPKDKIEKFLDGQVKEKLKTTKAHIRNNYEDKTINANTLKIYDWYFTKRPIGAGGGCFYKNQNVEFNPTAGMQDNILKSRKAYKDEMFKYEPDTDEFEMYDRNQATEKVNVNSYYGCSGARSSRFFNIYTASSTTGTGQSLISTTMLAFEAFLEGNTPFIDLDECFFFMENIRKEKTNFQVDFLPEISGEQLYERIKSMFNEFKEVYSDILTRYIYGLTQEEITRIYFKNNVYDFSYTTLIKEKLETILLLCDEFIDPNKVPEEIKSNLEDLWSYYEEFVFYNNFTFNRIKRLKYDKRRAVTIIDTDSNIIHLQPWLDFVNKFVVPLNDDIIKKPEDSIRFIALNTMSYMLTNMINSVMKKYCKHSNILKEFRHRIYMKNEFLFSRVIIAPKKKKYVSSIRLKEGHEIFPEKIDVKGADFIKSVTREATSKYLLDLVKTRILHSKEISIGAILRDLETLEGMIQTSLMNGEKDFLIPASAKEVEAYDNPDREQSVRSVIAWNSAYPDQSIELPDKVDMVKVKLEDMDDLESIKDIDKDVYDGLIFGVFNNKNKKIAAKGINVIAIPRNIEKIPEWIIPFIDYSTIISDNVTKFKSMLDSLGVRIIKDSNNKYFSNILDI